jgi:serine/arginine repetitive matrix protein 2
VPERMPLDEDDEEVDAERAASSTPFKGYAPQDEDPASCYSTSKLVIESEVSSDVVPSQVPPSPSSAVALSNTASMIRTSDESSSPQLFPTRLSVASRIQSERSPLGAEFGFVEVDEPRAGGTTELSSKRSGESGSTSTWEKVKNTLTGGRRSRTNSILTRDKREHTESGVSRESGASIVSAKTDKGDAGGAAAAAAASAVQQCHTPVMMQAPSASASILSLPPYATPVPRSGVSPVPPATSVLDLLKYQDAKLFPFPGMKKLEEQRNRARALTSPSSASSPDIVLSPQGMDVDPPANASSSSSTTPLRTPEVGRGRKLSHQASDTRLLARYNVSGGAAAATADNLHNFTQFPTPAPSPPSGVQSALSKLPTNREGVRKWLNAKKLFSSQSASNSAPQQPAVAPNAGKKPSLSDLLKGRKDDLNSDWDETGSDKSRTPTSVSATALLAKTSSASDVTPLPNGATTAAATTPIEQSPQHSREQTESENTPKGEMALPTLELKASSASQEPYPDYETRLSLASPLEPPAPSITPDPMSSAGYSGRSTSESSSTTSSHYSTRHSAQGAVVLERLDEMFGPGSRSPMWASAIDDPPRKLLLSSPVLQVVNSITVKDRFLFLFSDILVIAKPIMHEQEHLLDNSKPNPLDRKYVVQNVVLLRHLRFNADREEAHVKPAFHANGSRNPLVRTFVHQFGKDPDLAIANLFDKTGCRDDPTVLGQFLFRTLDIDRARLGDYLSRRTSKLVLKAYIDSFCFTGLRVDKSLRTFLHSIHIPSRMVGSLEYLLDAFAVRWYEANAGVVAYDKDVAVRLVRAIVQLNDVMHGNISSEPGPTGYPRRNVTSREFLEAFRRYDARGLVSDDLLDNLYNSIRRERLSQARIPTSNGPVDIHIAIKRPLPPRVTYRMQSEPIVLRIPQPDPQFTILLYGQDLVFEPPTLTFSKSSEASFRVTGTSLGPKTMIMHRSGPNALAYSGLPLNGSVIVERAFMRNTFQIAFENQHRIKRRYMFSVDDPLIRHQWTVSLKRQIDAAGSTGTGSLSGSRGSDFHRAADSIAFKVLQEVLLGADRSSVIRPTSNLEKGIHRVSTPSLRGPNGSLSHHAPYPPYNGRPDGSLLRAAVGRSKSRSKVYHRHGPGKLEQELNLSGDESRDSRDLGDEDVFGSGTYDVPSPRINGRLWSGRDLQMQCQQNSSVALVLAYLQVGAPDLDHGDS